MTMKLLYYPTPNGRKVSIALEEMALAYEIEPVDITAGEQLRPEFLAVSPNNKIPALIDEDVGGVPVHLFESGAILQYLGRKSGLLYPADEPSRAKVDSWLFWQMAGLGPMTGQLAFFTRLANLPDRDPRESSYAKHRYFKETRRLYGVLEGQLSGRDFICDDYGIADIASWTWVDQYHNLVGGLDAYPAIGAWHARIAERPAVKRGMATWMPATEGGWTAAGNTAQIAAANAKAQKAGA
jgi:GSH-dependent disulfide-bond oxidoreductase